MPPFGIDDPHGKPLDLVNVNQEPMGIIGVGLLVSAIAERLHGAEYEVFGRDADSNAR